jgi:hypothetical protein
MRSDSYIVDSCHDKKEVFFASKKIIVKSVSSKD